MTDIKTLLVNSSEYTYERTRRRLDGLTDEGYFPAVHDDRVAPLASHRHVRDPEYKAAPLEWAQFFRQTEVEAYLKEAQA